MGNRVLWLFFARLSVFAIILAAFIPSARGDTTYQYTGNTFQSWTGSSCLGQCSISGGLTLVDALPPNLSSPLQIGTSQLVTFSFTDGEQSWTYNNSGVVNGIRVNPPDVLGNIAIYGTNASGDITAWSIGVYTCFSLDCNNYDVLDTASVPSPFGGFQYDIWANNNGLASCSAANRGLVGYCAFNVDDPGTWTIAPEPSTSISIAIGLLVIVIFSYARGRT